MKITNNINLLKDTLEKLNFRDEIIWNKSVKIVFDSNYYFEIKRDWEKFKIETNLKIDTNKKYDNAYDIRELINTFSKTWGYKNFTSDYIEPKEIQDFNEAKESYNFNNVSFDNDLFDDKKSKDSKEIIFLNNLENSSILNDSIKIDEDLMIEKYKFSKVEDWFKDPFFQPLIKDYLEKIIKAFSDENINILSENKNIHIIKYAWEENELNNKYDLLIAFRSYFINLLSELKTKYPDEEDIWKIPNSKVSNIQLIDNDSKKLYLWFHNIEICNLFEVYSAIEKLIMDNGSIVNLNHWEELYFSIKDFFRLIYIKKEWKIKKLFARKVWTRFSDFKEIDFIEYDSNKIVIYNAKLFWRKDENNFITETKINEFKNDLDNASKMLKWILYNFNKKSETDLFNWLSSFFDSRKQYFYIKYCYEIFKTLELIKDKESILFEETELINFLKEYIQYFSFKYHDLIEEKYNNYIDCVNTYWSLWKDVNIKEVIEWIKKNSKYMDIVFSYNYEAYNKEKDIKESIYSIDKISFINSEIKFRKFLVQNINTNNINIWIALWDLSNFYYSNKHIEIKNKDKINFYEVFNKFLKIK